MENLQEVFERMIPGFRRFLVMYWRGLSYMVLLREEHRQRNRILI